MKHEVYRRLSELSEVSEKEYGKLIQKLLAIAFCKAGAIRLIERSTQGIDLEVTLPDERRKRCRAGRQVARAGAVASKRRDPVGTVTIVFDTFSSTS